MTGSAIGAPEPLVAATVPPSPPPQVTTGMPALLGRIEAGADRG